jgi:hypothetical protein
VPKHKFPNVKAGEIIRMRSVEVSLTTKRNVIQVKPFTNILKFYANSKIVKDLSSEIEDETNQDKLLIDDTSEVIMSPEIITNITIIHHKRMPTFKLNDLFC